jgi:hypothetical protein
MFIFYYAEYAYGQCAGPHSVFILDHDWPESGMRCNESVWLVPGTLEPSSAR